MSYTEEELKKELETKEYEYGFYTNIESETFPKGLNVDIYAPSPKFPSMTMALDNYIAKANKR